MGEPQWRRRPHYSSASNEAIDSLGSVDGRSVEARDEKVGLGCVSKLYRMEVLLHSCAELISVVRLVDGCR